MQLYVVGIAALSSLERYAFIILVSIGDKKHVTKQTYIECTVVRAHYQLYI